MSKENKDDILGGFSAIFDGVGGTNLSSLKGVEIVGGADDLDEYEQNLNIFPESTNDVDDDGIDPEKLDKDTTPTPFDNDDEEPEVDNKKSVRDEEPEDMDESSEQVSALFDALSEAIGWDGIEDESKPKTVEGLVDYMKNVVETNSKPNYANDEIEKMDEYVRNGGNMYAYFEYVSNGIDYDNVDLEDESNQKTIIRDFLLEKGFSEQQISRKISKYEEADLLEDEARDAIESLKQSAQEKKEALLETQKNKRIEEENVKQNFYKSVVGEIEALTDIRGIKIPKQDKQALMEYIFKVESDGRTKYQKDYSSSTKNLIESAYFTWKGDKLINEAKRDGETSAVERLKKTLTSTKVSGSKQSINNGSPAPLWSVASSQLLKRL